MEPRFNMFDNEIGAKFSKRFANASLVIAQSPLPKSTQELVGLRASQINGCGWCVDLHTKEAAAAGETTVRLNLVAAWRETTAPGRRLLALDPAQPVRGGPPLNDEHRGLLVEVGVHDLGDVGVEAVAAGSSGERPGPPGDLRLTRPLRFRAHDRVDRGAVQGEPRIPAQIRPLARVRHRAEGELAVLESRLDPGDPR